MIKKALKSAMLVTGVIMAVMLGTIPASAQQYSSTAQFSNTVAVATTNLNSVIALTKYADAGIQLNIVGGASSTNGNVTATFNQSVDAVNWSSAFTVVAAANGTTAVTVTTNVNVNAVGYLQLASIQNAAASNLNIQVTIARKPSRTGN